MRISRMMAAAAVAAAIAAAALLGGAAGVRSTQAQTPQYNLTATAVVDGVGNVTLTNAITDLGGGNFESVQWSTDYDETLVSFVSFTSGCTSGGALPAENDDGSRVLTGCISFAGNTVAATGTTFTTDLTCIAAGDATFTLTGAGVDSVVTQTGLPNPPISVSLPVTITCPGAAPTPTATVAATTATPTSVATSGPPPTVIASATPTFTPTVPATNTPGAATPPPVATATTGGGGGGTAPTATPKGGGAGAGGITPPSTGSGPSGGSGVLPWALLAMGILGLAGVGGGIAARWRAGR